MKFIISLMIFYGLNAPLLASIKRECRLDDDLRGHDIGMRLKNPDAATLEEVERPYWRVMTIFGDAGYFLQDGELYKRQLARDREPDSQCLEWNPAEKNLASFQDGMIYVNEKPLSSQAYCYWALGPNKALRIVTNEYPCQDYQLFQDANRIAEPVLCAGLMDINSQGKIASINNQTNSYMSHAVQLFHAVHFLNQLNVLAEGCVIETESVRKHSLQKALVIAENFEFYYKSPIQQ